MFLLLSRLSGRLNGSYRPVHEIALGAWRLFIQEVGTKKCMSDAQKQRATLLRGNTIYREDAKVSLAPQQSKACP